MISDFEYLDKLSVISIGNTYVAFSEDSLILLFLVCVNSFSKTETPRFPYSKIKYPVNLSIPL